MTSTLSTPVWRGDAMHDSDEDGDEINTANARVFFGALKSPELKFAHLHTPKACRPRTTHKPTSPAGDAHPDEDLISFDADEPMPATAAHPDDDECHADPFETTTILDAPPLQPAILSTPSRVPLPPSPLTAEDIEVEHLLTPRAAIAKDEQSLNAGEHKQESPTLKAAIQATADLDRALHATTASLDETSTLGQGSHGVTLERTVLSVSQHQAVAAPQPEGMPRTPTSLSLEEKTEPTSAVAECLVSPGVQVDQKSTSALTIAISLSPSRLQTPKRKHAEAFRAASPDPAEVRKKQFGAQRLAPAANDAPRKPGPSKSSVTARRPVQRPPMLGSLSPESDGMLSRLLAPSSTSSATIKPNINIDFSRMPSLGAGAAELHKDNAALGVVSSPSRPASPKRVPVSVIFRSPSPQRRVLGPPHLQSSPPKSVTKQPSGLMATRAPPFPVGVALTMPDEQRQPSPVKPSRIFSSPVGPAPSMLRQPTVRAASRLPKPKPYAPPSSKLPTPSVSSVSKPLGLASRSSKGLGATKVVPSPPHTTVLPQSSPSRPQGPIMIRQVIPGMLSGKTIPAKDAAAQRLRSNYNGIGSLSPARERVAASKTVDKAPIPIRQVIPGTLRHYEGRPTTPPPVPKPADAASPMQEEPASPSVPARAASISLAPSFSFLSGVEAAAATPVASSSRIAAVRNEHSSSPSPLPNNVHDNSSVSLASDNSALGRRSGRINSKPATEEKRSKPQSRVKLVPDDLRTQARKLQALTTANTTQNDGWQVAIIETRVVRRPGPRPPSPSSKLRGEAETRREDAIKERERRARRRAGEDVENDGAAKRRHLKGPGDDSEYETPDNVRVRSRYVRWDPGLVSTPQRRGADEPLAPSRSCLATPAPKPGAPIPSEREKVVVTKIVYDDDEEALESSSEPEASAPSKAKGRKRKAPAASTFTTSAD